MPYSIDYNLVPLPLAALAVWDRRDPLAVHAALVLAILTWGQPLALPLAGDTLLLLKLSTLYAVGTSLALKETSVPPQTILRRTIRMNDSKRMPIDAV